MQTETMQTFDETAKRIYPIQFVQEGPLHDVPVPLVRVSTCGGLQLEVLQEVMSTDPPHGRYQVVILEQRPNGSSTGLTLLKILASLPEHYAAKDWLTEYLPRTRSSDEEEERWGRGLVRVDNVVSLLRSLLCPSRIVEEQTARRLLVAYVRNHRESGSGYRLASNPLLWLDVDVIAASVKQALFLEHQGKDALPCWEQAHMLASKGGYLPNDCYSDWTKDKRMSVEGYLRQSVHALRRLYLARNDVAGEEQAILLLRTYWYAHPTDEDVLRPLLELLGQHDGKQEAKECYHHLCERLEQEGSTPDPRTQKIIQNVLHSGQSAYESVITALNVEPALSSHMQDGVYVPFSHIVTGGIIEKRPTSENQPTSTILLRLALESDDESVKRREATRAIGAFGLQLLGLPVWEQLSQTLITTSSMNAETLAHLEQLSDVCWRLANDSQGMLVAQILPTFLPKLTILAGHPSPHQQKIASLVTRGYILAAEVEKKNISAMTAYCEYAVIYSELTNDDNIKADALRQKATIALIAKESSSAVITYQQSLPIVKKISPLLRSRIYLGTGSAYARIGQKQEALRYLGFARDSYPDHPEKDPTFLYLATSSDRAALHLYEALTYSDLQQPEDAWNALMRVDGMHPKIPIVESTRIEFLNLQAKTAALSGDMERSLEYLRASVKVAKTSEYTIWVQEAYDVYLTLCQIWPHEKQIKSFALLFS